MMPKGVEHSEYEGDYTCEVGVRIPMMPKGVEHSGYEGDYTCEVGVRIPMMPKGVEHSKNLRGKAAAQRFRHHRQ